MRCSRRPASVVNRPEEIPTSAENVSGRAIGCGRYRRAHAQAHYERTTHLYALELETQRVWDYAGDGYVHRLIQNKADGKLVELPSAASSASMGRGDSGGGGDVYGEL